MPESPTGKPPEPSAAAHSRFGTFFRGYGLSLGVVLAAVPLLATSLDLLPAFSSFGTILTFATSLISLLTIAFLFGIRRLIGEAVFPPQQTRVLSRTYANRRRRWSVTVPLLFATISIGSLTLYLALVRSAMRDVALDRSIVGAGSMPSLRDTLRHEKRSVGWLFGDSSSIGTRVSAVSDSTEAGRSARVTYLSREAEGLILSGTSVSVVPNYLVLMLAYVLIFWGVAAAFVWLGLVEYMQQELGVSDANLIQAPYRQMDRITFQVPGIEPGAHSTLVQGLRLPVVFEAEFDPLLSENASVFGPLCGGVHGNRPLFYQGLDADKSLHRWACMKPGETSGEAVHLVFLSEGEVALTQRAREAAREALGGSKRP